MQLLCLLQTADSDSVGRFNTDSLPQQALIELLVQNLAEVSIAKDAEDNFIEIEKWSIFTFDAAGSMTHIQMMGRSLRDLFRATQMGRNIPRTIERNSFDKGGEIDLQYCPASVKHISIICMKLRGTVSTEKLPRGLVHMDIKESRFKGPFTIGGLPETIEYIGIPFNRFTGSLDLPALPRQTTLFIATKNKFSGTISLSGLPEGLRELKLSGNLLRGEIIACQLPHSLQYLVLSDNDFDGDYVTVEHGAKFACFEIDSIFRGRLVTPDGEAYEPDGLWLNDNPACSSSSDSDDGKFGLLKYG